MQYVPDPEPKRSRMESIRRWIWVGICVVLFGPFALIFLFAITGNPVPDGHFGTWFMGSLTVAGVLSTLDFARGVKMHGPSELGCVIPMAAITFLWGYAFLKGVGVFE